MGASRMMSRCHSVTRSRTGSDERDEEVGMSTNYTVVQYQRDLRDAQNSELRVILNYRKALVDFERLQIAK